MGQTAFVTGAGGCVGRQLVQTLLRDGHDVVALLVPAEVAQFAFRDEPRVTCVVGALNKLPDGAIPHGATIYHLAAQVHTIPKTPAQREEFFRINRDGTADLAQHARAAGAAGFVFISTIAVYGAELERRVCDETVPPVPNSPYGQSKWEAEQRLAEVLADAVPHVTLRPSVIYGPGDRGNFARLIAAVQRGSFPVVDGGGARKNTLYVRNLAETLAWVGQHAAEHSGRVYNVADPEPHSLRAIAETVARVVEVPVKIRNLPSWALRPPALLCDAAGAVLGRELPLSTRRIRVMTTDSLVDVRRLHAALAGNVRYRSFEEGLREYLRESTPAAGR